MFRMTTLRPGLQQEYGRWWPNTVWPCKMLLKAVRALPAADALEPVASAIAASTAPSNPLHPDDQRLAWSVVRDHILDVNHVQVLEAKLDRLKEECLKRLRNQWLRDVLDLIDQHYHDGCGGVDVQDYFLADVVSADRMLEIEEIGLNERQDITFVFPC